MRTVPTRIEVSPGSYGGTMMDGTATIRVLQYWAEDLFEWVDVPEVRDE